MNRLLHFTGQHGKSFNDIVHEHRELMVNSGGSFGIVGTPEQVVEQIGELAETGIDGLAIGMYDYLPDMMFFGHEVMPLLQKAGLHA